MVLDDAQCGAMECEVCGRAVPDQLESCEVIVRQVRYRNVPTLILHLCQTCSFRFADGIKRRAGALQEQKQASSG